MTERGNINRRIIAINNDFIKAKNDLVEIGRWIGSKVQIVRKFFRMFSKEQAEESLYNPDKFSLYNYLNTYNKMQSEIARTLDTKNRSRKSFFDTKKSIDTLSYMSSNKIYTIIDFQLKKDEVNKALMDNKEKINDNAKRLKTLETLFKQADIIEETKSVYNKYVNMDNSLFNKLTRKSKDDYYKEHKKEIEKFKKAKSIIIKLDGGLDQSLKAEIKDWKKEKEKIKSNIVRLEFSQKEIQKQIDKLNHIKYMVDKVNEEYGIDINVVYEQEYHKAIARGEQPTTMTEMRYWDRQNKLERKKKEKTQEYYKEKAKSKNDMER